MVNVPPLFCSTPPPLDLVDDDEIENDDDIDTMSTPSPIHRKKSNSEYIDSMPPLPDTLNEPLPFSESKLNVKDYHEIEFHNNVKYIQSSPPATPSSLDLKLSNKQQNDLTLSQNLAVEILSEQITEIVVNDQVNLELESVIHEEKEEDEKNEKLAQPNANIRLTPLNDLYLSSSTLSSSNKVLIEDIENDASEDELYSPTMLKNFTEVDINSTNYFIIENIHKTVDNSSNQANSTQSFTTSLNNSTCELVESPDVLQASVQKNEVSNSQSEEAYNSNNNAEGIDNAWNIIDDDEDEFGDFNTFQQHGDAVDHKDGLCTIQNVKPDNLLKTSEELIETDSHTKHLWEKAAKEGDAYPTNASNDFTNALSNSLANNNDNEELKIQARNNDAEGNDEADDDDEFGDFNTAEPIATNCITATIDEQQQLQQQESTDIQIVQQPTTTSQNYIEATISALPKNLTALQQQQEHQQQTQLNYNHNLNDRISKILIVMFPKCPITIDVEKCDAGSEVKDSKNTFSRHKLNDIPFASIDSAKALEFQWSNSQSRQTFIQSLGIDSRNILFGDNWNPTLPRYAANLSFNPLRPMKMKTVTENIHNNNNVASEMDQQYAKDVATTINSDQQQQQQQHQQTNDVLREKPIKMTSMPDLKSSSNVIDNGDATNTLPLHLVNEHLQIVVDQHNQCTMELSDEKFSNLNELDKITTSSTLQDLTHSPCEQILNNTNIDSLEFAETNADMNVIPALNINSNINTALDTIINNNNNSGSGSGSSSSTCDVMATSTYAGSFKETHIYTPSKSPDINESKNALTPTKIVTMAAIDFDYKKAAMGVIIDETVVKKEYRDIVYEPEFSLDHLVGKMVVNDDEKCPDLIESNIMKLSPNHNNENDNKIEHENDGDDDEFTDFQCVTSNGNVNANLKPTLTPSSNNITSLAEFNAAKSVHGMILSPAILLPQAIPFDMQQQATQIEWGDSAASINPEELARIEELFPEPKSSMSMKSSTSNSSQKSTPTHLGSSSSSSLSISAAVAQREQREHVTNATDNADEDNANDEDDWSEFISVPIDNINTQQQQSQHSQKPLSKNNRYNNNNYSSFGGGLIATANSTLNISNISNRDQQQQQQMGDFTKITESNLNPDEEWSDFVSSAMPATVAATYKPNVPQFNSGAWQNANYYNNPLSLYHKGPINLSPTHPSQSPKHLTNNNNNNNNINNNNINSSNNNNNYPITSCINNYHSTCHMRQHSQQPHQQQIHIMQNFSTISMPTGERVMAATNMARNTQLQMGTAKVAPSIALIPDLGFIAPAIPTHTSFINSLPRPSMNAKK